MAIESGKWALYKMAFIYHLFSSYVYLLYNNCSYSAATATTSTNFTQDSLYETTTTVIIWSNYKAQKIGKDKNSLLKKVFTCFDSK